MQREYSRRWGAEPANLDEKGWENFIGTILYLSWLGTQPRTFYREDGLRNASAIGPKTSTQQMFWRWLYLTGVIVMRRPTQLEDDAGTWDIIFWGCMFFWDGKILLY